MADAEKFVTPDFWKTLPTDPGGRVLAACRRFRETLGRIPQDQRPANAPEYAEAFGILTLLGKRINFKFEPMPIGIAEAMVTIQNQFHQAEQFAFQYVMRESIAASENKYADYISEDFVHEFEESDIQSIQNHLNTMRDIVRETDELDEAHKRRVTAQIEALQRSLGRKMSRLDQLGGFMLDMLAVATKVTTASKPLLVELREVFKLVWKAKRAAEGIPEGKPIPRLPLGDGE